MTWGKLPACHALFSKRGEYCFSEKSFDDEMRKWFCAGALRGKHGGGRYGAIVCQLNTGSTVCKLETKRSRLPVGPIRLHAGGPRVWELQQKRSSAARPHPASCRWTVGLETPPGYQTWALPTQGRQGPNDRFEFCSWQTRFPPTRGRWGAKNYTDSHKLLGCGRSPRQGKLTSIR